MKKFYLTLALFTTVAVGFAQQPITTDRITNVTLQKQKSYSSDRAVGYYYIDYEGYESQLGTQEFGVLFFNRRNPVYFSPSSVLGMNQAAVVFDTMIVTPDGTSYNTFSSNVIQSFDIDTAYIRLHHQNNSSTADTIILTIKNVTATGTPGSTVLWGDTVITSTGLTGPGSAGPSGWSYPTGYYAFPINYTVGAGGRFSLYVEYYGAAVDTFGLISNNLTTGNPCSVAAAGNEVITSEVFPSAFYRYWNNTTPPATISGINPNGTGAGGLFIDCDGDGAGGLPADWPTEQAIQAYSIYVSGNLTDNTGIDEEEAGASVKAYPNPARDFTTIEYTLKKDANVSVVMTDLSGKVIYSNNLGKRDAGTSNLVISTTEFSNGVYMYTLNVDNKKITRRIIVNK